MLTYLRNLWRLEPAVVAWSVNGGLASLLAFVFHFSSAQEAAVTTISTAVVALVTAAMACPPNVSVLTGALAAIATAAGAFGLHLGPQATAASVTALSAVLGLLLRQNLTPAAKPGHPEHAR